MRGTYCPQCDSTRWQLTGLPVTRATTCSECGAQLQPERRLPGRKQLKQALTERRSGLGVPPSGARPVT